MLPASSLVKFFGTSEFMILYIYDLLETLCLLPLLFFSDLGSLSGMIAEVLHTDKRDSGDSEFDTQSTGCLVSLSREGTVDMVDQACHSSPASFSSHCSGGEKPVCMDISMTSPTSSNEDAVDSNLIDSIADSVAESSLMQSQNSTLLSTTRLLAATSTSGSLQPPDNQVPEKVCVFTLGITIAFMLV